MAWGYKRTITIDETKCGTADSSNFPVLIYGTYDGTGGEPDFRSVANGGKVGQANAYDIAFYSDEGLTTLLDFERVSHNLTTGAIQYWVKIPTLSSSTNTVIYVAYGDSGASDLADITGTWSQGYMGVWHMEQDPSGSAPQLTSSTNTNHGTSVGTMLTEDLVPGVIGNGIEFDGTDDRFTCGDMDWVGGSASCWGYWTDITTLHTKATVFGKDENIYTLCAKYSSGSSRGGAFLEGTYLYSNSALVSDSTWFLYHVTWNGTVFKFYKDGDQFGGDFSYSGNAPDTGDNALCIGSVSTTCYFIGKLDELRMNSNVYSASWIKAEYNNQYAPATFYAIGDEVEVTGGGGAAGQFLIPSKYW